MALKLAYTSQLLAPLSRLWCECQLHSDRTARTALHWCVRTTPPHSANGGGRPCLPGTLPSQVLPQAEEPGWIPSRTSTLQIGNPRKPLPLPDQLCLSLQHHSSLHLSSLPQTTCEQNKTVPEASRCPRGRQHRTFQFWVFCQCGSLMSQHPTGRHGNAVLIISLSPAGKPPPPEQLFQAPSPA